MLKQKRKCDPTGKFFQPPPLPTFLNGLALTLKCRLGTLNQLVHIIGIETDHCGVEVPGLTKTAGNNYKSCQCVMECGLDFHQVPNN